MPYTVRRPMTIAGRQYAAGDEVDAKLIGRNTLAACLDLGRIVFSEGPPTYAAKRRMTIGGVEFPVGAEVPSGTLDQKTLEAAIRSGHIVPMNGGHEQIRSGMRRAAFESSHPNPMHAVTKAAKLAVASPGMSIGTAETIVKRRGRPPRRVQTAPAVGSL